MGAEKHRHIKNLSVKTERFFVVGNAIKTRM